MKSISHLKQHQIWEQEHRQPYTLVQMDSERVSSGVVTFFNWLKANVKVNKEIKLWKWVVEKGEMLLSIQSLASLKKLLINKSFSTSTER
jgi:hypothetical protein